MNPFLEPEGDPSTDGYSRLTNRLLSRMVHRSLDLREHGSSDAEFRLHSSRFTVTSSSMADREQSALLHVARFRFVTAEQLTELLFTGRDDLKESSRQVMSRQILASLQKKGLIARTPRSVGGPDAGSVRSAYYIRPAGMRAVWELGVGVEPKRTAPRGTFLLRHSLALVDIALTFDRAARETRGHAVIAWEPDWEAALRADKLVVVPDAFLSYRTPAGYLDAFIEADLGTMGSRFFEQKIDRYLNLYSTKSWESRHPKWPTVLTVTTTPSRSLLLRAATERALKSSFVADRTREGTEFAFVDLPSLISHGPLARIWQYAGQGSTKRALFED